MQPQPAPYGSLAQESRTKQLKSAKQILWFVGIITLAFNVFLFVNVEKELEKVADTELQKQGSSLREQRARPAGERAEFEAVYAKALKLGKLIHGAQAFLGLVFIGCALMVQRKPVPATVTGLVLYLGSLAAWLALDPASAAQGLLIKVVIIVGLISAVKAALALERNARAPVRA